MEICICQYDIEWENKQKNKEKILKILSDVSDVDLIVFPETSLSGFSFNKKITTLSEEDIKFFSSIAKNKKAFVCFGGIVEDENSCIFLNPEGDLISKSSKIHLFSFSREHLYHKDGSRFQQTIIKGARISPFVCYDLRFAPLFWVVAEKTDIYIVIANWPSERILHWKTLLQARAIENQAFVIGVNRTGKSPSACYSGVSCVINPEGKIIFDAKDKEAAFVVNINLDEVQKIRQAFPVIKDRKKLYDYLKLGGGE